MSSLSLSVHCNTQCRLPFKSILNQLYFVVDGWIQLFSCKLQPSSLVTPRRNVWSVTEYSFSIKFNSWEKMREREKIDSWGERHQFLKIHYRLWVISSVAVQAVSLALNCIKLRDYLDKPLSSQIQTSETYPANSNH